MKKENERQEKRVLQQFCRQLGWVEDDRVRIVAYPDRKNRRKQRCDAILRRGRATWAVEHTRVYDRLEAPRLEKRLRTVVGPIVRNAVSEAYKRGFYYVGVPLSELRDGEDCEAKARALGAAAVPAFRGLGDNEIRWLEIEGFEKRPVAVMMWTGGGDGGCGVGGVYPDNAEALSVDAMRQALQHKGAEMVRQREQGRGTMLLLDLEGVYNCTWLRQAHDEAARQGCAEAYDDVYAAFSGWEPILFVPLKAGGIAVSWEECYERWTGAWQWAQRRLRNLGKTEAKWEGVQ